MTLDEDTNYIVSGLERSGTSMLMQILDAAGIPCGFDKSRKPDENNPKGYFELEGGKIINKLIDGTFSFEKYKGKVIKITAYGLKFLPPGKYKIIYSERNIEEILDSMEKMTGNKDKKRIETKKAFTSLNKLIKKQIQKRNDVELLLVNYNSIIANPHESIKKIHEYLKLSENSFNKMLKVVDESLYRNRKK